jgi:hypothetical protein
MIRSDRKSSIGVGPTTMERPMNAVPETLAGGGIQRHLLTNPLFFQHFQRIPPETLDRRGAADTFVPSSTN